MFSPAQDLEIAARYKAGETMRQIGSSHGVTWRPVQASLKRTGTEAKTLADYGWQDTPENRAEIIRLRNEGLNVNAIGRQAHASNEHVSRVLREAGIPARYGGTNRRFKGDQIQMLMDEYAAGATLHELARRHGGSAVLMRNTLKRVGVEIRPYGHDPRFWTPERIQWLREQWEAGRSQSAIAREIGYTQTTVGRALRNFGITVKPSRATREDHGSWKGGRTIDGGGYARVRIYEPSDRELFGNVGSGVYVAEHRLVMSRALGRPLKKTETIHHINGDKTDNRLENLQLRQGKHGTGVKLQCLSCGSHDVEAVPLD